MPPQPVLAGRPRRVLGGSCDAQCLYTGQGELEEDNVTQDRMAGAVGSPGACGGDAPEQRVRMRCPGLQGDGCFSHALNHSVALHEDKPFTFLLFLCSAFLRHNCCRGGGREKTSR